MKAREIYNAASQAIQKYFKDVTTEAFETAYGNMDYQTNTRRRVISKAQPFNSITSALLGTQTKYIRRSHGAPLIVRDRKAYNWFEQFVFLPGRLVKNLAKLGTEFLPNLLTYLLRDLGKALWERVRTLNYKADLLPNSSSLPERLVNAGKWLSYKALAALISIPAIPLTITYAALALVGKVTQSITSPFTAMKESYYAFAQDAYGLRAPFPLRVLGGSIAALRGLIALSAYAAIAVFAAPVVGGWLGGLLTTYCGSAGAWIVGAVNTALAWTSSLPVISTIGSAAASGLATLGSYMGLSTGAAFAATATAAIAIVATPVLAALKVLARHFIPGEDRPQNEADFIKPAAVKTGGSSFVLGALNRCLPQSGKKMSPSRSDDSLDVVDLMPTAMSRSSPEHPSTSSLETTPTKRCWSLSKGSKHTLHGESPKRAHDTAAPESEGSKSCWQLPRFTRAAK